MPDSPLTLTDVQLRILRDALARDAQGGAVTDWLTRAESGLIRAGLITRRGAYLRITEAGREALEGSDAPETGGHP